MRPQRTSLSLRRIRWGLVLAAGLLAVALSITSFENYRGVRDASTQLARGQASVLIDSLRSEIRDVAGPPTQELLKQWLDDHQDEGARYIALGAPHRRLSAGVSWGGGGLAQENGVGISYQTVGDRIVVTATRRSRRPKRNRRRNAGPKLTLEFEPLVANRLKQRANGGVWLNTGVATTLLLAAFLSFGWLRGREKQDQENVKREHLANLGEMSAVLAHEIRNPLAALKGHAQLLEERLANDPNSQASVEQVVLGAGRLEQLTNDLLDFVRTGQITLSNVVPVDVLQAAVGDVDNVEIQLVNDGAPSEWTLDPDRMRQALTNILRNATEALPSSAPVMARVCCRADELVFEIRDSGPGIAEDQRAQIFEPFHTTRTRGTGLGLAIAQRIVLAHGGSIVSTNHPNGGSVFTIRLPDGTEH